MKVEVVVKVINAMNLGINECVTWRICVSFAIGGYLLIIEDG